MSREYFEKSFVIASVSGRYLVKGLWRKADQWVDDIHEATIFHGLRYDDPHSLSSASDIIRYHAAYANRVEIDIAPIKQGE